MPIPNDFSKSPFEINHPNSRWRPDIDPTEEDYLQNFARFIENIREQIYDWRQFGYEGISETSKTLLDFWFNTDHERGFTYYFGQSESVETVIYIFENYNLNNKSIEIIKKILNK